MKTQSISRIYIALWTGLFLGLLMLNSTLSASGQGLDFQRDDLTPALSNPAGELVGKTSMQTGKSAVQAASTLPLVRVAYLIPVNRTPQAIARKVLQKAILMGHVWFRDQMEQNGFGPKTFRYETEADGVTPLIHVVSVPFLDHQLRGNPTTSDIWYRTLDAARIAGLTVSKPGEVWLLVPEAHLLEPDGTLIGGAGYGASWTGGSGNDPGAAVVGAQWFVFLDKMEDDRSFDGLVFPEVGPYPLRRTGWLHSYSTVSQIGSVWLGATLHELGHAFGLTHNFLNDAMYHGNLMGHGFRGIRGNLYPDRYPAEIAHLSYASSLILNTSHYFNDAQTMTGAPDVRILSSNLVDASGQWVIEFEASDPDGLASAIFVDENVVGEMPLTGTSSISAFRISRYTPGTSRNCRLTVIDTRGIRTSVNFSATPDTGNKRAPVANFKVIYPFAHQGNQVTLDAGTSTSPGYVSSSLLVEWDLNNDGVFDTPPTTNKLFNTPYSGVAGQMVRLKVTNPQNAYSVSSPLFIYTLDRPDVRVDPEAFTLMLPEGGQASRSFSITNRGARALSWHLLFPPDESPKDWLVFSPPEGSLGSGASDVASIDFVAGTLSAGTYETTLNLISNDPDEPLLPVPVRLSITSTTIVDTTAPECELVEAVKNSHIKVRVEDPGSGLKEVKILKKTNSTVVTDAFITSSTDPVFVTATKILPKKPSVLELEVTDMAGNVTRCDPVLTTLAAEVPSTFALEGNYPNPFNPSTTIRFQIAEPVHVSLTVYDVMGRTVARLVDQEMAAGSYAAEWDGKSDAGAVVAGGIYFYRLEAGSFVETRAMSLVK